MPSAFVPLLLDYATETTLALVRAAVDAINAKLPADPATVTAQGVGNASLASIDGKVTACNTGAVTVAASALPTGAATEAGHLATIDASTATTATQTTTTATNTGTIAGAVSAPDAVLPAAAMQIAGIASTAAPSAVTSGRGVRAWFSLVGAQMMGVLGANGSAIASSSNGVPVVAQTSSTWDVSDRAARLLGALTGVNGSGVATGANPVPMQLSSGSTLYTGATAALSLPIVFARSLGAQQATLAINGDVIKASSGSALWITITNTTGSSVYWQIHDLASGPPSAGARAAASAPAITANNGSRTGDLIGPTLGLGCNTGILLVLSLSPTTYSAVASNSCSYSIQYI